MIARCSIIDDEVLIEGVNARGAELVDLRPLCQQQADELASAIPAPGK